MTFEELKQTAAKNNDEEEFSAEGLEEEVDDEENDSTLEENLQEACETIEKLLLMMEQITIVPKGRVVKRLPRNFIDVMQEADEFLEELDYERSDAEGE